VSRKSLAVNLLLSFGVTATFLAVGELVARRLEREKPDATDEKLALWEKVWHSDFYVMQSTSAGWPPSQPINGDGLQDRTHAVEKPEGTWRVVILGDSVTAGPPFQPAEGYPAILQSRLDERGPWVEVFSVALWGWSTRQERFAFERIARRYRPDQVIVGLCLNDVEELQNNLARPPALVAALHRRSALVRRLVRAEARQITSIEELFADTEKTRAAFERLFAEMRLLRDEVRASGATFSVLVFPVRFQYESGSPPPRAQKRLAEFCAAEGIRCLDLQAAFASLGRDGFEDLLHFTAPGRRLVAQRVLAEGLIPAEVASARSLGPVRGEDAPTASAVGEEPPPGIEDVAALTRALGDPRPRARTEAAWALGRLGAPAAGAVPALISALGDAHESVRAFAASALGSIGLPARAAVSALRPGLRDPRQSVRWRTIEALGKIGGEAEATVPALVSALESPDAYVRAGAVCALRDLGPQARAALPALAAATHDESFGVRAVAVQALVSVGGGDTGSVTALTEAMRGSTDGDYRWKAARALGQIGPAAVAAAPALVQALSDDNGHVRREAAIALGKIGPAAAAVAAGPLARALEDSDPTIRTVAARALGRIRAASAAPALARHLEDDDEAVRQAARSSLEAIRGGTR